MQIKKFSLDSVDSELNDFIQMNGNPVVLDHRAVHLGELFKIRDLGVGNGWDHQVGEYLSQNPNYGTAVFYPWRNQIFLIASENDFIEIRTARNRNKITIEEQKRLSEKCIGIVGLSVGFSVFMAAVLERVAQTIKIADFDVLSLSNLNRLPFSSLNVGKTKVELAYQWAMEIDPYLNIELFPNGITTSNLETFFHGESPLDLVVDECDDGRIKLELRLKAIEKKIPLLMETSDRGLLDVENYQSGYELFHGRIDSSNLDELRQLSSKELIMMFVDISTASFRGKKSMLEIGKTLDTWPQLASDVLHGGGSVIIAARNILLGNKVESGRYFMDLQEKLGVNEY